MSLQLSPDQPYDALTLYDLRQYGTPEELAFVMSLQDLEFISADMYTHARDIWDAILERKLRPTDGSPGDVG